MKDLSFWAVGFLAVVLAGCSPRAANGNSGAEQEATVSFNDELATESTDYEYTKPHENTSTERLIKEVADPDCEGLDEEECASRTATRQLELEERGVVAR